MRAEIGERDGMGVVRLIEKLYDELIAARGEVGNFSSFLRVSALRYMALQAQQRIPMDPGVSIRSLDASKVLHALPDSWASPSQRRQ